MQVSARFLVAAFAAVAFPLVASAQDAPFECDNNFGDCGTPNMSGGGGNAGGGAVLINNTDLGDTYQRADDFDDDGIEDNSDNCPRVRNAEQFDRDGDNVGDACDNCENTRNEDQLNLDEDSKGDACDADIDNDDIPNEIDNCVMVPNQAGDEGQPDLDEDGLGDACDDDIDGDSKANLEDPCPFNAALETPSEAEREMCFPDMDGDGFSEVDPTSKDNCPTIANEDQKDTDNDGIGDKCDGDRDNDGVPNKYDNCDIVENADQIDIDRDGKGDGCDDKYCYAVYGDTENCLDPEAPLAVYSPSLMANTGDAVPLRLFANRESQPLRYSWAIVASPNGSRAQIAAPQGSVEQSSPFEYRYVADRPVIVPDVAGEYVIRVQVEGVFEDANSSEVETVAQYEMRLRAEGETQSSGGSAGGCDAVAGNGSAQDLALLFFAGIGLLGLRRRRA
jgi:hypothetical protein